MWHEWKQAGKPRGDNPLFCMYKDAKRRFRCARRNAEIRYEQNKIKEICRSECMDQSYFWYIVNRNKKRNGSYVHPIKLDSGKVLTDPQEICHTWAEYFQNLYTPKHRDSYNDVFKTEIENK